jgi:hypothetical protein
LTRLGRAWFASEPARVQASHRQRWFLYVDTFPVPQQGVGLGAGRGALGPELPVVRVYASLHTSQRQPQSSYATRPCFTPGSVTLDQGRIRCGT